MQSLNEKRGNMSNKHIINCGGFIRRKSDEIDYEPRFGVLYDDGTVKRKRLVTTEDRFEVIATKRGELPFNMKEFIEGLEGLGEQGMDFKEAVRNHLEGNVDIHDKTKEIIQEAIQNET